MAWAQGPRIPTSCLAPIKSRLVEAGLPVLMSSGWAPCQGLDRTGDRRREGHLEGTWGLWLGPPGQPQQCQGVQTNAALTLAAMGFGFHPPGLEQALTQWAKQTQTQVGQLAMQ